MSAFLVSEQTIQNVVSLWHPATEIPSRPVEELDNLGQRLWSMNADAVSQRYSETPEQLPAFRYRQPTCSLIQAFKSAVCLRYQCMEGDVPERPLYRELDTLIQRTASAIVYALPEYDRADWG